MRPAVHLPDNVIDFVFSRDPNPGDPLTALRRAWGVWLLGVLSTRSRVLAVDPAAEGRDRILSRLEVSALDGFLPRDPAPLVTFCQAEPRRTVLRSKRVWNRCLPVADLAEMGLDDLAQYAGTARYFGVGVLEFRLLDSGGTLADRAVACLIVKAAVEPPKAYPAKFRAAVVDDFDKVFNDPRFVALVLPEWKLDVQPAGWEHPDYVARASLVALMEEIFELRHASERQAYRQIWMARPRPPQQALAGALRRDQDFFLCQRTEFLGSHRGQFVAIRDGEVIGFAKSMREIEDLIQRKVGPRKRVLVKKIEPEAFTPVPDRMGF